MKIALFKHGVHPFSLSQRIFFFVIYFYFFAFELTTKALNAKGTLLIHQWGGGRGAGVGVGYTEGCSGSLDRQRLKFERQRGRVRSERRRKGVTW